MFIERENYIIRNWKIEDAKSLSLHANNKDIAKNLQDGFPSPYTYEDAFRWIKMVNTGMPDLHSYAIVVNGKAAGSIGITFKDDVYRLNAEIGYFLGEEYWNKGIMTGVIKDIVSFVFLNFETIRIYAEIFESNIASGKVLEKAGFKKEAVLKKNVIKNSLIMDSHIYAILKVDI